MFTRVFSLVNFLSLSPLCVLAHVRPLSYSALCLSTCALTQRICLVALFLLLFFGLMNSHITIQMVLILDATAIIVGGAIIMAIQYNMTQNKQEWSSQTTTDGHTREVTTPKLYSLQNSLLRFLSLSLSSPSIPLLARFCCLPPSSSSPLDLFPLLPFASLEYTHHRIRIRYHLESHSHTHHGACHTIRL